MHYYYWGSSPDRPPFLPSASITSDLNRLASLVGPPRDGCTDYRLFSMALNTHCILSFSRMRNIGEHTANNEVPMAEMRGRVEKHASNGSPSKAI
jgi:hypothetical protein